MAAKTKSPKSSVRVVIPGRKNLHLRRLLLDFNGTLATDGKLVIEAKVLLRKLAEKLEVVVLTADTYGTARRSLRGLPLDVYTVKTGMDKWLSLGDTEWRATAAIGNGANDVEMAKAAALSIGILGREGTAAELLRNVDIVAPHICAALELLVHPKRLVATLRN